MADPFVLVSGALRLAVSNEHLSAPFDAAPYELSLFETNPATATGTGAGAAPKLPIATLTGAALDVVIDGRGVHHTLANGGLQCANWTNSTGTDAFGVFSAVSLDCQVVRRRRRRAEGSSAAAVTPDDDLPVTWQWRAYSPLHSYDPSVASSEGRLVASVQFPEGANDTATDANLLISPFPAWNTSSCASAGFLCYGGDKAHLFASPADEGGLSAAEQSCFREGGGPATLLWPSNRSDGTGLAALVSGPASAFHLAIHKVFRNSPTPSPSPSPAPGQGAPPARVYYDAERKDAVLCLADSVCDTVQSRSGYTVLFEEGFGAPYGTQPMYAQPLYFSWSEQNLDNWETISASQPGQSYTNFGNKDGAIWLTGGNGRNEVVSYSLKDPSTGQVVHHVALATAAAKAWAVGNNYTAGPTLGYLDPPHKPVVDDPADLAADDTGTREALLVDSGTVWGFGVAGEVAALPRGFAQDTLLAYSSLGVAATWDVWGTTLRRRFNTTKRADFDPFVAAMSIFTDNGAATLGAAWPSDAVAPPVYNKLGPNVTFGNYNWSMVDTGVLAQVTKDTVGANTPARGMQLDCWWYPRLKQSETFWCASDWILPDAFYENGTGGVRSAAGVPLMLYFPAACPTSLWSSRNATLWPANYSWADPSASAGFLIPSADDSARFWSDLFDYAAALAAKGVEPSADAWPHVWVPPMVREGWRGTNVAAYETDFYSNIVAATPAFRQVVGAGEKFLQGIHEACTAHNMTAQLCAGSPANFLEALTMPSITNARASIDYDWDGTPTDNSGTRGVNGAHNWAAADNAYIFWATRVAPSKDNFWTTYFPQYDSLGAHRDSGRNGMDAELHAIGALLSTGPVGLGDYAGAVNATLLRRLARGDGILLRPDRPLGPMDVQWGTLPSARQRSMPGFCSKAQNTPTSPCGARLWQTSASVAIENESLAPELVEQPTRRLVSHTTVDKTRMASYRSAQASSDLLLLQHLIVSVDQNASLVLRRQDFYPPIATNVLVLWRRAADGGTPCLNGTDALRSGCLSGVSGSMSAGLFDVSTQAAACSQGGVFGLQGANGCMHAVDMWQVFLAPLNSTRVFLGDVTTYVSLSGYRFRLTNDGTGLVILGSPGDAVTLTYAVRETVTSTTWRVFNQDVTVGESGRTVVPRVV